MSNNEEISSIRLDEMSLDQLQQIRQQEDGRRQGLTQRYAQLRAAAARIHASRQSVQEIQGASAGKEVLVPLTDSVFVPGKLREPNRLLVELGTGYYVEKTSKDTEAFLDRKMRLVDANTQNIATALQATSSNMEAISTAMQGKFLEIRARQAGMRHRSTVEGTGTPMN
jgi:prefoldin alpha subunit